MLRMHMNPDEAVRAHLDLHSQNSIAIHFGLIDNAGESYEAPIDDLIAARRAHGVDSTRFVAPHYGQVLRYTAVMTIERVPRSLLKSGIRTRD